MSYISQVKERLAKFSRHAKKSLGQNFLVNESIMARIVDRALRFQAEQIIEIGPGLGALTDRLQTGDHALVVIELDTDFAQHWRDQGLEVLEQDALRIDWGQLLCRPKTIIVSNLPYQISSSLVIEMSLLKQRPLAMVLMFQKEVAQRIRALPSHKEYGFLSVIAQLAWKIETLLDASPRDFYPPPKIASRVLVFQRSDLLLSADFKSFVKLAFSQRRKRLLKNLSSYYGPDQMDQLTDKLIELGYNNNTRAEELTPQEFLSLHSVTA